MNGPRRSSKTGLFALLLALAALGLAGYAAWAASQPRGADPAVAAQLDSLRSEVRDLRARGALAGDTLGLAPDSAAAGIAVPGTQPGTQPPPVAPAPAGQTTPGTRPANRTTQP